MLEKTKRLLDVLAKHEFFKSMMLVLPRNEIHKLMISYGAILVKHNHKAIDYRINDVGDMYDYYLKYMLNDVKVEFFSPPFNSQ